MRSCAAAIAILVMGTFAQTALGQAAPAQQQTTQVKGVIKSVAGNHRCFTVTDKRGNDVLVLVGPGTGYAMGQEEGKFVDAVVVGDKVTIAVDGSGTAVGVVNKNKGQRMSSAEVKELLGASDEECDVLVPLIGKVQMLERGADGTALKAASDALRAAVGRGNASASELKMLVRAERDARAKAQKEVEKARGELLGLLTVRQEAVLVQMGVLE